MPNRWKPSVTVAAVIEQQGRYLLIEEHTPEGLRWNNPAGHLEAGESPEQACVREALEETAHPFTPTHLVGVYLSRFVRPGKAGQADQDVTYVRMAFGGFVGAPIPQLALDKGIVRTEWMTLDEVRSCAQQHRSPLVLRCVLDHARGQRFALTAISTDAAVFAPPSH